MGTLQQIHRWSLTHHPRWLVVLRVALGLILIIKGYLFMSNASRLTALLESTVNLTGSAWMAIVITWAHLLGGFLIIIGLFTRLSALIQLPILIGAIFFLSMQPGFFDIGRELPLAIIALLLVLLFLVEGGGPLSLDHFFSKYEA